MILFFITFVAVFLSQYLVGEGLIILKYKKPKIGYVYICCGQLFLTVYGAFPFFSREDIVSVIALFLVLVSVYMFLRFLKRFESFAIFSTSIR